MLQSLKSLEGHTVVAPDGVIGRVIDFYFDDTHWIIRHLVVAIGEDLPRRKVLISPIVVTGVNWADRTFTVSLTRDQVLHSPDIDTDKPVSRQHELGYQGYYGYGAYWGGGGLWGAGLYPDILQAGLQRNQPAANGGSVHASDAHLRSGNAILSYYVHASDGDIGHVDGILVDEETWSIRYIVVDTSNWWLGHRVILAPRWIEAVSWTECTVSFGLDREQIKNSQNYDPDLMLDRTDESSLYAHYGRSGYWIDESPLSTPR